MRTDKARNDAENLSAEFIEILPQEEKANRRGRAA
jgi:hypothetical protein